jgi:hypothetical protein
VSPDPLAYLHATLDAAQAGAEAVSPGLGNLPSQAGMSVLADKAFVARNPAAVLRRIAADRELIADLLAERHLTVDDCWYTCAAATEDRDGGETCDDVRLGKPCDCGRDARVQRRVRIMAEGWGWTEEVIPDGDAATRCGPAGP